MAVNRHRGGMEARALDSAGKGRELSGGKYMNIREGDLNPAPREHPAHSWASLAREPG